jgi:hypothetical protein
MNHFCQIVHHHQNGIIRIRRWKICDEVHGNWISRDYMDRQWFKETMRAMTRILCSNTNIAKFDKFLHILPKLWPMPIILKHWFHGLIESKMTCSQNIMLSVESLKSCKAIKNI